MSVSMLDNISYLGKKPDNVRSLFNTVAEMVAFNENYLPDVYECNVIENSARYRYSRSNSVDEALGKWRLVESGVGDALLDHYKRSEVDTLLEGYVPKEPGKSLTSVDFTPEYENKLNELNNYDDTDVLTHISTSEQAISDIHKVIGNSNLTTSAQNLSDAVNELKLNCDTVNTNVAERLTKTEEDITVITGDSTTAGSVDSKVLACLNDSKAFTLQKIEEMSNEQAIVCDEKPTYTEGTTTYIKDGVTQTTTEENIWFYYVANDQLMQTIWITGIELTIVSAGGVNFEDLLSKTKDVVSSYIGDEADTSKIPDLGAMKNLETKLQHNIDTRVKGTDIYDGLDSTSITSPLAANQGRLLNEAVSAKLDKTFTGDDVSNKPLVTDSLGNVSLGTYDDSLNNASSNAVQNKVVTSELDKKFNIMQDIGKVGYVATVGADGNMTLSAPTTLGGAAEVVTYTNESYPELTNVDLALDKILAKIYYEAPKITSFTVTPSTTEYEIGTVIPANTLVFSWASNKEIKNQTLTDMTIALTDRTATYSSDLSATKTFTLTISDGENSVTSSKRITFSNRAYWGSAAIPTEYNSSFILGLSSSKFASSKSGTYSMSVGSGEYGYIAIPTSFGSISSVWIGGFEVDIETASTVNFTNSSGHTSSYTVYKTGKPGLGSVNIEVK